MRNIVRILTIVIFVASCNFNTGSEKSMSQKPIVAKWPHAVMYEIFPRSFADSNGDGIGDINGMTAKLDYLQELGIKGVWLMPIMPSPSYHKYDVTDYYAIHPDYGTMEDFKRFVDEAHKRNIKVVIDMIINHSSNDHPWFRDSKTGEDARYRDYYVWADDEEIEKFSSIEKAATGDSYNITQWHEAEGNEEKFYGFFTGMMPDLNFDNPLVRDEVIAISKFWLHEVQVDGFRLDAARHIYEDSRVKDNENWWKEYRAALTQVKPDVYLVGEVWEKTENIAPFLHGLPALFNFDLAFSMLECINRGKSVSAFISEHAWDIDENLSFESGYLKNQSIYQKETSDYQDAIFLSNHDQNRILSALDGNLEKGKLAASLLLTMPGTPYIYYGEEIGMLGEKPDPNIREPFLWDEIENDVVRTNWIAPEFTTDETVTPLSRQINDKNSIYNHYKSLIHFRNSSMALTFGDFSPAHYGNSDLISFYRKKDNEHVLVIHNLCEQRVTVQLKSEDENYDDVLFSTYGEKKENGSFDLEPHSTIILIKR